MSETLDTNQLLVRIFEMLRMHQEAVFRATIAITATIEALKESDPDFGAAYDRHFWAMKQGELGEENAIAVRIIDQIKRQMRGAQGQAAGAE